MAFFLPTNFYSESALVLYALQLVALPLGFNICIIFHDGLVSILFHIFALCSLTFVCFVTRALSESVLAKKATGEKYDAILHDSGIC